MKRWKRLWDIGHFTYELLKLLKVWYGECVHTPPVSPKIFSRSGGTRMSLPITEDLNPGAYCSTQSNAKETNKQMQVCPSCTSFHIDLKQYIKQSSLKGLSPWTGSYLCLHKPLCLDQSTPCLLCGRGWTGWRVKSHGSQGEPESDPTQKEQSSLP